VDPPGDTFNPEDIEAVREQHVPAVLCLVSRGWMHVADAVDRDLVEELADEDRRWRPQPQHIPCEGAVDRVAPYPRSAYVVELPEDPDYWWPDDYAWCLSGDTDFHWAYLAGSEVCVNEVLDTPVLDAVRTEPTNPAVSGMDRINPRVQG